jgi:hypothetical protein
MKWILWALVVILPTLAVAKDRPAVAVEIVGSKSWDVPVKFHTQGSSGTTNTDCNVNGNYVNCTSSTTGEVAPQSYTILKHNVSLRAVMPDGSEVYLWCRVGWRFCAELPKGSYKAEIDKKTVWIYATFYTDKPKYDSQGSMLPRKTQIEKIKFEITGGAQ